MRILDFGAGKGVLMKELKERGAEVCGVEPYGWKELVRADFNAYPDLKDIPIHIDLD